MTPHPIPDQHRIQYQSTSRNSQNRSALLTHFMQSLTNLMKSPTNLMESPTSLMKSPTNLMESSTSLMECGGLTPLWLTPDTKRKDQPRNRQAHS